MVEKWKPKEVTLGVKLKLSVHETREEMPCHGVVDAIADVKPEELSKLVYQPKQGKQLGGKDEGAQRK